jgi:hypothetical protein
MSMSRYIWKLCGVSFAFGGAMEFVMIKTGFCKYRTRAREALDRLQQKIRIIFYQHIAY